MIEQKIPDSFFVARHRVNVDQRARKLEYVHNLKCRSGERQEGRYGAVPDSAPPDSTKSESNDSQQVLTLLTNRCAASSTRRFRRGCSFHSTLRKVAGTARGATYRPRSSIKTFLE